MRISGIDRDVDVSTNEARGLEACNGGPVSLSGSEEWKMAGPVCMAGDAGKKQVTTRQKQEALGRARGW